MTIRNQKRRKGKNSAPMKTEATAIGIAQNESQSGALIQGASYDSYASTNAANTAKGVSIAAVPITHGRQAGAAAFIGL